MFRLIALVLAMLLIAPSLAEAKGKQRRRPMRRGVVSVQLEDAMGRRLRTFQHRRQTFVLGRMRQRYNIRVRNLSMRRVEVVVSVDGRDVITGRRASSMSRGYVVSPRSSVLIQGFRTSMNSVAAFRFTSPKKSYAGKLGHAHRVGVIRVAAFREKRMMAIPRVHVKRKAPSRTARGHKPRSSNLGTQFGERRHSVVRTTRFIRARRNRADQRVILRYDDARGLRARGIRIRPWPKPMVFAKPPRR